MDAALASRLAELGQSHIGSDWPAGDDAQKAAFAEQLAQLEANYPGGVAAYLASARSLLAQSQRGENPLAGWRPSVPEDGFDIAPGTDEFERYERRGLQEAGAVAFVVPAGGLGERLGYHGVKFALPSETSSGAGVLETYVGYIRAAQRVARRQGGGGTEPQLPLAIMVSDDTEAAIRALLEANGYYGLAKSQVSLLKQEKVAALADAAGTFAMGGRYSVLTKPHGHGDVHFLLHSSGLAARWAAAGVRWVHFFQDTNTLYFCNYLATIGVSATHGLAANLVACPRKAKEAIGGITKLSHEDGRSMVCNVEYNQLEPLLVGSGFADGDVNEPAGEMAGFSRFPGNINQIVLAMGPYLETLARTGGAIDEFINPKYTDASRRVFKSPTRLECMMQDYVKTVDASQTVGWTRYPPAYGYFPCKNDIVSAAALSAAGVPPHSASSSEMAVYQMHAAQLAALGARLGGPSPRTFRGVQVDVGPSVVLAPSFAPCFTLLGEKLSSPSEIEISSRSTLVVRGDDVRIGRLKLDGALYIDVADGGSLEIVDLELSNGGNEFVELSDDEAAAADETIAIRGFKLAKRGVRTISVGAGDHIVVEGGVAREADASRPGGVARAADASRERDVQIKWGRGARCCTADCALS